MNAMVACDIQKEVRIATVMYGGISLAIYMNGIAQELLSLVRSTAPDQDSTGLKANLKWSDEELSATERVYRDLAREISVDKDQVTVRFIVDILSGTSAGGLNGMFLAKALANELGNIKPLEELWILEGDIDTLLYDKKSLKGLHYTRKISTTPSFLNSNRMCAKLVDALGRMQSDTSSESCLVDELDLYMTATDLRGLETNIYLSDRVVQELRHRAVFHFRFAKQRVSGLPSENDFTEEEDGFLAFVGRATSSIVPAFEPMRLNDLAVCTSLKPSNEVLKEKRGWANFYRSYWRNSQFLDSRGKEADPKTTKAKYDEKILDFLHRDFGDGGYLDNKPFSYATDRLAQRTADVPVDRKLFYVEPDPVDLPETNSGPKPNAAEHGIAALTLPAYESIREDIERIRQRNDVIDRISRIISHVERVVSDDSTDFVANVQEPSALEAALQTPTQLGYFHLRFSSVTDELSNIVADIIGFEEGSPYRPPIRYLVKAWRDETYQTGNKGGGVSDKLTRKDFINTFDFAYVVRCLTYIQRRISKLLQSISDPSSRQLLLKLKRELNKPLTDLRSLRASIRSGKDLVNLLEKNSLNVSLSEIAKILSSHSDEDKTAAAKSILHDQADGSDRARMDALKAITEHLSAKLGPETNRILQSIEDVFQSAQVQTPELSGLVDRVHTLYKRFPLIDEVMLPLTYASGALESNIIDIRRISPMDALSLVPIEKGEDTPDRRKDRGHRARRKLVGTTLGHFGAFFDMSGRMQDILWGRLDAAERIVASFVNDVSTRKALRRRLHLAILCDPPQAPPAAEDEDKEAATKAMNTLVLKLILYILEDYPYLGRSEWAELPPERALTEAENALLRLGIPEQDVVLVQLRSLARDPEAVRRAYLSDSTARLNIKNSRQLNLAGRSMAVASGVFSTIQESKKWKILGIAGSVVTAIGKVLVPNSVASALWDHWYGLLMLLSVVLIAGGLLGSGAVGQFGWELFGITFILGIVVSELRKAGESDSMKRRFKHLCILLAMVLGLIVLGVMGYALYKQWGSIVELWKEWGKWIEAGGISAALLLGIHTALPSSNSKQPWLMWATIAMTLTSVAAIVTFTIVTKQNEAVDRTGAWLLLGSLAAGLGAMVGYRRWTEGRTISA